MFKQIDTMTLFKAVKAASEGDKIKVSDYQMTFREYDFDEYREILTLATDDGENEITVDIHGAWDDFCDDWNENEIRNRARAAVSASFPGARVDW